MGFRWRTDGGLPLYTGWVQIDLCSINVMQDVKTKLSYINIYRGQLKVTLDPPHFSPLYSDGFSHTYL